MSGALYKPMIRQASMSERETRPRDYMMPRPIKDNDEAMQSNNAAAPKEKRYSRRPRGYDY